MNRKFRVLMLSVFAVLFAASSAFAVLTSNDTLRVEATQPSSETDGYNYYQVVYIVDSDNTDFQARLEPVRWEVSASGDSDIGWLHWTVHSYDVVIEGTLPPFNSSTSVDVGAGVFRNEYGLHVVAYVSKNTEESGIVTVSCDVNGEENAGDGGLAIRVAPDTIRVDSRDINNFTELVSVNAASADGNIHSIVAKNGYSVTITFPTTSVDGIAYHNAELACNVEDGVATIPADNINLPTWLKYQVVSYDKDEYDNTYVSKLRIFYSADEAPATMGSVRITVVPSSVVPSNDDSYSNRYADYMTDGSLVMGWFVFLPPAIWLDTGELSYDVMYGTSTDVGSKDLTYHGQTPVEVLFSPDISADVKIAWKATAVPTSDDENAGYITLTVTPVTPLIASYDTLMRVADSYDNYAFVYLVINVSMDAMYISPDVASASVTVDTGKSADVTFTAYNFNGKVLSWDLGTIPSGITVTSSDSGDYGEMLTITVVGKTSGDYSFDVKAKDSFDRTASTVMYVKVLSPDVPGPDVLGLKVDPVSRSITVKAGGDIVNVTFKALDESGDVAWSYGTLPSGITMLVANAIGDRPASGDRPVSRDESITYGVRADSTAAAGRYNVTITASDDVKKATATLTIVVSSDVPPTPVTSLTLSPSAPSVSVAVGAIANLTLTASNNSGLVTWTIGTQPSGATVAVANNTANATQYDTVKSFTVMGVTAGTYSTTITAADAGGHTATATLNITVTSGGVVIPTITPTPTFSLTETLRTAIREALIAKLGSIITSSTKVVTLPASALNGEVRAVGTTAIYLPEIKVSEDAVYVFNVNVANFVVGHVMKWEVTVTDSETDELVEASDAEDNAIFLNDSGEEITTVPANKSVNVAAYFEAGKTYSPVITASAATPTPETEVGVGSASGGCSAGLGALVSVLAAAFFISKKRA